METKHNVVLFATHFINDQVINRYYKLRADLPIELYDVFILLNTDSEIENRYQLPLVVYSVNQLNELSYNPICETLLPGSCHFPILAFFKENQTYSYYWFIEYDVVYNGNWNSLMEDYKYDNSDFLSCYIERYDRKKNDEWPWWHLYNNVGFSVEKCVKGFNPICRYSSQALRHIDHYQTQGYSAHSEVLITTCLYNAGFKITDFGGNGDFTPAKFRNKHYIQKEGINNGTMRWRPGYLEKDIILPNTLYHPVKSMTNKQCD